MKNIEKEVIQRLTRIEDKLDNHLDNHAKHVDAFAKIGLPIFSVLSAWVMAKFYHH